MYINIEVERLNDVKVIAPSYKNGEWTVTLNDSVNVCFRNRNDLQSYIDEIQQVLSYVVSKEAV